MTYGDRAELRRVVEWNDLSIMRFHRSVRKSQSLSSVECATGLVRSGLLLHLAAELVDVMRRSWGFRRPGRICKNFSLGFTRITGDGGSGLGSNQSLIVPCHTY